MQTSNQPQIDEEVKRVPRRFRGTTGMFLLGVMLVLLLILTIALIGVAVGSSQGGQRNSLGALGVADASVTTTAARMRYYGALNAAETGVRSTLEWLSESAQSSGSLSSGSPFYPDSSSSFFASNSSVSGNYKVVPWDNNGTATSNYFAVRIYPYSTDTSNTQQKYIIESVGVYNGATQIVRAAVQQLSFANYALFLNNFPSYVISSGNNVYGGPVFINGNGSGSVNVLWKNDTAPNSSGLTPDQIFMYNQPNAFVTAAPSSSVNWYLNSTSNTPATPTGANLNYIFGPGAGMQTGASAIPVPSASTIQSQEQTAAYGGTTAPAASSYGNVVPNFGTLNNLGVAVPATGGRTTGGVVIQGGVDDMVFSTSGSPATTQVVTIYQNQTISVNNVPTNIRLRTTVTISRTSAVTASSPGGTTTVETDAYPPNASGWVNISTPTTYQGTTNGVIYDTNSNIGSNSTGGIHGTIADNLQDASGNIIQRNSLTVADPSNNVYVSGSVLYNTHVTNPNDPYEAVGNADKFKSGMLGVVGNTIEINRKGYNAETQQRTSAELNNIEVDAIVFANNTFDAQSYSTRAKGVATLLGGYIANQSGDFGTQDSSGNLLTGFRKANNYDDRVLDSPPPAFPNTASRYQVTSFQRVTQTLDGAYSI